jgi:CDP-glucose 4,6-dehydratase
MPDIVRGLMNKQPVLIRNSSSTRPWQHVLDPLMGYLAAIVHANRNYRAHVFTFGPIEKNYSVLNLIKIIESNFPKLIEFEIKNATTSPKFESSTLEIDSSLSQRELDWHPVWSQEEAITTTIDW